MKVARQGDRKKTPTLVEVRPLTREEILALHGRAPVLLNNGRLGEVTITSVKTWKTDPDRIEVGVKYGMYEYAKFSLAEALDRFVKVADAA